MCVCYVKKKNDFFSHPYMYSIQRYNKNMYYLFFDFETDGIGRPITKQNAIEIAWITTDQYFNETSRHVYYFDSVQKVNCSFHGEDIIYQLENNATSRRDILLLFLSEINKVLTNKGNVIAHNIEFDLKILLNECEKEQLKLNKDKLRQLYEKKICTMQWFAEEKCLCNKQKHKLEEVYAYFYHEKPSLRLHEALNDVIVLKDCFQSLVQLKHINTLAHQLQSIVS